MDKKGIDLLMSFDTTGSMSAIIASVRRKAREFTKQMFANEKDIRIGIIAHGDYCDANNPYTIRCMDFTRNPDEICKFIMDTENTYGGDADECYELVLQTARTGLSWGAGRDKVFILIGDASPHEVGYRWEKHTNYIDWKNEAGLLSDAGIKTFAVHALPGWRSTSKKFYETVADVTGGLYLTMDQFTEVNDLIQLTTLSQYDEEQLNQFVTIIRDRGGLTTSIARNISRLTGKDIEVRRSKGIQKSGLVPVVGGRFQIIEIPEDASIREFVEGQGLVFKPGRVFYELVKVKKAPKVQQYKEIILEDPASGELFNGTQVREYLRLLPQIDGGRGEGAIETLRYDKDCEYTVFIQSTSYNRKLLAGTRMLYEVHDI